MGRLGQALTVKFILIQPLYNGSDDNVADAVRLQLLRNGRGVEPAGHNDDRNKFFLLPP